MPSNRVTKSIACALCHWRLQVTGDTDAEVLAIIRDRLAIHRFECHDEQQPPEPKASS